MAQPRNEHVTRVHADSRIEQLMFENLTYGEALGIVCTARRAAKKAAVRFGNGTPKYFYRLGRPH